MLFAASMTSLTVICWLLSTLACVILRPPCVLDSNLINILYCKLSPLSRAIFLFRIKGLATGHYARC